MAITYPVPPDTRWAVLQLSTGEIISRNKPWPREDGAEIAGLDPDFVYLLHVDGTAPQYDSRYYTLNTTETPDADANTLVKSYTTNKRPVDEIKVAAENVEADQFNRHFAIERALKETAMMVGLIYQFTVDSQAIPQRYRAFAATYRNKVKDKILPNLDTLNAKLALIDAGEEPDLDADYTDAE